MKICMLTTSFPRFEGDYAGKFIYELARGLVKQGVRVSVVAPSDDRTKHCEVVEGIEIRQFRYMLPASIQRLAYDAGIPTNLKNSMLAKLQIPFFVFSFLLCGLKSCRGCDLIHAHWIPSGLVGILIGKLLKKPVILTVRGTDIRSFPKFLSKAILKDIDQVVSPNLEIAERLKSMGIDKFHFIPNPIDESRFSPTVDVSYLKQEFDLDSGYVVCFVGRLYDFKDPLTFVRAIPYVLERLNGVKFFVVGDGILFGELQQLVRELGIEECTFLTGARKDVAEILRISTVFVALSPIENIGSNALVEAMFMGVPCIVTNTGYSSVVFTHLEDACLIEPRNERQLAETIVHLLGDARLRARLQERGLVLLGKEGRRAEDIVACTISIYERALSISHRKS